jgi:hypothetical protein
MLVYRYTHLASIESDTSGGLSWQEGEMRAITQNQDNKQQIGSLSSSCRTLLKTCVTLGITQEDYVKKKFISLNMQKA